MCGLWGGYSGTLIHGEKELIKMLAGFSYIRGVDSTGVTVAREDKHNDYLYQTTRALFNPVTFMQDPRVEKLLDGHRTCVIMGHNRLATAGEVNLENTQPLKRKNHILTHNGTIRSLMEKGSDKSDSNRLADIMEEKGHDEAISKIGAGAAALVWLDTKEHTLNFFRNLDRPLYYVYTPSGSAMFWASEEWMLTIAAIKTRITIEKPKKLEPDVRLFWEMDSMKEYREPKKKHEYSQSYSGYPSANVWNEYLAEKFGADDAFETDVTKPGSVSPTATSSVPTIVPLTASGEKQTTIIKPGDSLFKVSQLGSKSFYCGFNNSAYSPTDIARILDEKSCEFCENHGDITKPVYWISTTQYLCPLCNMNPLLANMYGPLHQGSIKKYN